jgi:hypothetical protein
MAVCPSKYDRLIAQLEKYQNALDLLWASYDELIVDNIQQYEFDSNEGRQEARTRRLEEVQKQIDRVSARIDSLCGRLSGTGLVAMKLRRKPGGYSTRGNRIV